MCCYLSCCKFSEAAGLRSGGYCAITSLALQLVSLNLSIWPSLLEFTPIPSLFFLAVSLLGLLRKFIFIKWQAGLDCILTYISLLRSLSSSPPAGNERAFCLYLKLHSRVQQGLGSETLSNMAAAWRFIVKSSIWYTFLNASNYNSLPWEVSGKTQ